jgi:hypothetical protein
LSNVGIKEGHYTKEKLLDRIYRMCRIFFAFPEERQKGLSITARGYNIEQRISDTNDHI